MDVAITSIQARVLEECLRDMEELEFASAPWRIRWDEQVLRPAQDGVNRDFLWSRVRERDMFCDVPVISNVWLKGYAIAQVVVRVRTATR